MKIYFTRHGESEANTLNVYSNRVNGKYPLTQKGIQQAEQLAKKLENIQFAKIYSSPLLRAVQTTEILNKTFNIPVEINAALREYDTGILEEHPKSGEYLEIAKQNDTEWFVKHNYDHKIEGGESFSDIKKRFGPFIKMIIKDYGNSDANILIVAHGGLYQTMFPVILTNISTELAYNEHLNNCEYIIAELERSNLYCIQWRK